MYRTVLALVFLQCVLGISAALATDYYVDSSGGNDLSAGTTEQTAWKTLLKVNNEKFKPGDRIRFRCDCTWRGQLVAKPGEKGKPVVYTSYGTGKKPLLLGSVSLADVSTWVKSSRLPHVWETRPAKVIAETALPGFTQKGWVMYTEQEARVSVSRQLLDSLPNYHLVCSAKSKDEKNSHIQFSTHGLSVHAGQVIAFRFKMKSTIPFKLNHIALIQAPKPWATYGNLVSKTCSIEKEWNEFEVRFTTVRNADDGRLVFFLGSELPQGAQVDFCPVGMSCLEVDSIDLPFDVGNIILKRKGTTQRQAAFKRWEEDQLKEQDDFLYDRNRKSVLYYSKTNPALLYDEMEAALRQHNIAGTHDVLIDGLALSRSAAHGVGGGGQYRVTIRNCDITWIGGGELSGNIHKRVRFGNGVEFWAGAFDNLVENNFFAEVYDVAMSNQGRELCEVKNVVWRNNIICRCEQSYEIWFTHPETQIRGLVFEHNTSVDTGFGWSHRQRPDKRGTHLLSYQLKPLVFDMSVRKNVFCHTKNDLIWFYNERAAEFKIDDNVWWQPAVNGVPGTGQKLFFWDATKPKHVDFAEYRKLTGNDAKSRFVEPKFMDPGRDDFRITNREQIGDAGASR